MSNLSAGVTDLRAWLPRRQLNIQDTVTNTVTTLLTLEHTSTGTVAANFGLRLLANLEDASGNAAENAGALDFIWADATGGSEDCDLVISLKAAGAALAEKHRFSSTGVYSPAGGITLTNADIIGVKDIYGSSTANHNFYANAAVTDATARTFSVNVLDSTANAWLEVLRITPDAADPWASWGYKVHVGAHTEPVNMFKVTGDMDVTGSFSAATLSAALNANSQAITNLNMDSGTIDGATITAAALSGTFTAAAAVTLPAFTLGGNINAGANNITVLDTLDGRTNSALNIRGLRETTDPGIAIYTTGVTPAFTQTVRLSIAGGAATTTASWANITHSGIVITNASSLNAANGADGDYFTIGARDSDTDAIVEVARVFGAADPYFSMGGSQQNIFYNSGKFVATVGVTIGADSTNNLIDDASNGGASQTLYIGNLAIQMVSDVRVKANIAEYQDSALDLISKFKVIEFDYLDGYRPYANIYTDRYVGLTAQELFQLAPWTVNTQGGKECPACLAGQPCAEHLPWQVNYGLLTGLLVKAIQELKAENRQLKAAFSR